MICPICRKDKKQLYGDKVDGKYLERCWQCAYPKKK